MEKLLNFTKSKKFFDGLILVSLLLFSGILGVKMGLSVTLDFLNYHFYAPYAFIHNRIGFDIMPADIQSYFNPFLDFPFYLLVKYFNKFPNFILFINSFYYGIFIFLVYKLYCLIFNKTDLKYKPLFIFISVLTAMFSPILLNQINQQSNDVQVGIGVLLALILIYKYIFEQDSNKRTFNIILSGLILGITTGLKLYASIYFIAIFLAILLLSFKIEKPFKTLVLYSLSVFLGFVIIDGYWLYLIYSHYKNPFFPYFNNIFHSPYANFNEILDSDFSHLKPNNLFEFVFYPFLDLKEAFMRGTERKFYDLRYAISYICIFGLGIQYKNFVNKFNRNGLFLTLFIMLSYFFGILIFSQYRYLMPVNALTGSLIIFVLLLLFKNKEKMALIMFAIITVVIFTKTSYINEKAYRIHPKYKLVNVQNMNISDNALVILASRATSILTVNQNPKAKYVYLFFPKEMTLENTYFIKKVYLQSSYFEKELKRLISENKANTYIIYRQNFAIQDMVLYKEALKIYSDNKFKDLTECQELRSNLHTSKGLTYFICKINYN